ncbi:hypothetical protein [Tepidibacillus sp. HK-1]|uniref:hypothetical protein n=1 Tax=Tepidibacillus sp. HK-1 TaxID=1883407 RepID=UPI000853AFF4|nr:hypothetical protein [Tepidibacillus sp. HK-1]GBF12379.1 hypothetical protein HK1_02440 [Tepidibacillus sp. HK-1]
MGKKIIISISVLITLSIFFYILSINLSPEKVVLKVINKIEAGNQLKEQQKVTKEISNVLNYFKSNKLPSPHIFVHKAESDNVTTVIGVFTSEKYNPDGNVNSVYTALVTFYLKKKKFIWEITDVKVNEYKVQH